MQERYDILGGEPWCYLPEQIRRLTDRQIDDKLRANARFGEAMEKRMTGDMSAGASQMIEEGVCPSFEFLWASCYAHMPGMTPELARGMYDRQKKQFEAQQAERKAAR